MLWRFVLLQTQTLYSNNQHDSIKKFKFVDVMKPPVVGVIGFYMNEA